jgi:IMP dehydrogenase
MIKTAADFNNLPIHLTYDDVLLAPGYSDFTRQDIDLSTKVSRNISIKNPLVSAPMDTVTESKLAVALAKTGGLGIIHRNLTIKDQVKQVSEVLKQNLLVGAAVGSSNGYEKRIEALLEVKIPLIVIDSAHGYCKSVIEAIKFVKKKSPRTEVMAGNIATYEGAQALIKAGADSLRVGMGPGAICTTRIISGMGMPQLTSIVETARAGREAGVPVIADGGIRYSGDMVKALAAGANAVMMGSYFASCLESPGEHFTIKKEQIPFNFRHLIKLGIDEYTFKTYRGMGSQGAMKKGAAIKSEAEFHGKNYKDRVLVAEGVDAMVPVKGSVKEIVDQALGGIKSGFYYVGCKTIGDLQQNARFIRITDASLKESHPHDLIITDPGKNY